MSWSKFWCNIRTYNTAVFMYLQYLKTMPYFRQYLITMSYVRIYTVEWVEEWVTISWKEAVITQFGIQSFMLVTFSFEIETWQVPTTGQKYYHLNHLDRPQHCNIYNIWKFITILYFILICILVKSNITVFPAHLICVTIYMLFSTQGSVLSFWFKKGKWSFFIMFITMTPT
jgi:hypothetical protein